MRIKVTCPYCGNEFWQMVELHDIGISRPMIILCDIEETPGCDRYFAANFTLSATSHEHKIDGYEDA